MGMPFDLSDLTEETLCEVLEAVQTALRKRQSVYLRECSVEPHEFVERSSLGKTQRIRVSSLSWEERGAKRTLHTILERREGEAGFDTFLARVGEIMELVAIIPRSHKPRSAWYVVCNDGSLKKIRTSQKTLAQAHMRSSITLAQFHQMLDAGKTWDDEAWP